MKIKLTFLILLIVFILSSCQTFDNQIDKMSSTNIEKPDQKLQISGIWNNIETYQIDENNKLNKIVDSNYDNIFLSKTAFDFKKNYVLNPDIISRYIEFNSYILSRFASIPDDIKPESDKVPIIKFTNKTSFNQEFILISENKLITIYLGKIYVYEKTTDIDSVVENKKYEEVKTLLKGGYDISKNNFGLSIAFRKLNNSSSQIDYDYFTYYIKQTENDNVPLISKVPEIVIPKSTGLWSIVSSKAKKNSEGFENYVLSANPTFLTNNDNLNNIQDTIYRRIDYVNSDYIAVTNFGYLSNDVSENYSIFNMENLSKKEDLSIMNIAGAAGKEALLTNYKKQANNLINNGFVDLINTTADLKNIGMKRAQNSWKFYSNIEQTDIDGLKHKVFRTFELKIAPIINIGATNTDSPFTWSEIKRRRPEAIDATISPDNNYVLIQLANSLEFYPVYYNNIGNKPLFTIQNVENYEIVMSQWITNENINSISKEYDKLKKINSYIIYPQS